MSPVVLRQLISLQKQLAMLVVQLLITSVIVGGEAFVVQWLGGTGVCYETI